MRTHIILPKSPILMEEISGSQAVYSIEPLNPGYGVTLANSLRRVMLSSLPGSAVTYYKIKGVDHEFSTIPNVIEDVVDITLNVKALRFQIDSDEPVTLMLKASGSKAVTGADIKLPAGVTLINKDAHILTLSAADASLEMELVVEKGVGFKRGVDQSTKSEVGLIAVDSIFTPVIRASYDVQDMRVGDKTNYNRVVFNITTDGTVSPLDIIQESAKILVEQFQALLGSEEVSQETVGDQEEPSNTELSSIKIETLDLPQRTLKSLESVGIMNLAQIAQMTRKEVLDIKGISDKALEKIEDQLKKFEVSLEQ